MATKKKTKKQVPVAAVATGVLAAAAAAGAAYYFYGAKNAKQHRKSAVKWAHEMKREVVREAKKIQKIDEEVIHGIITQVAGAYRGMESVDPKALREAVTELKTNWRKVAKEIRSAQSPRRTTKKTAKKRSNKTT